MFSRKDQDSRYEVDVLVRRLPSSCIIIDAHIGMTSQSAPYSGICTRHNRLGELFRLCSSKLFCESFIHSLGSTDRLSPGNKDVKTFLLVEPTILCGPDSVWML
jgi:hypothetical protein